MADVTGSIVGSDGTKDVRLNNAATEATLKALLATANIDTASLRAIAAKAGIDNATLKDLEKEAVAGAASIQQTAISTDQLTDSQDKLVKHNQFVDASFAGLIDSTKQMAAGNATLSGVLGNFSALPGPLGLVVRALSAFAEFQETNMKTYRDMSSAGANFSGSLTDMRVAAQGAFVDLQTFGALIKNNSQVLGRMGGSVDDGARAFAAMSNSLITSGAGEKLLALGYSTEDVNQGMLSYIATSGGRTKKEMENTAAITAATAEYMTELDKLTQFTGINRKTLEEDQKKAAAQQAFQRKMASLGEEERAKLKAAYDAASASGIAGATDAVMSAALGMPPLTKEAQQLAGTLPGAYNGLTKMTDTAMRTGSSMDDVRRANGEFVMGAVQGAEQLGATGDALSLQGNQTINGAIGLQNQMNAKGIKSADDYSKAFKDIGDNQAKQAKSQADTMAVADRQLKEFGIAIMRIVGPILGVLTPVLSILGPLFLGVATGIVALKAAAMAYELFLQAQKAKEFVSASGGVGAAGKKVGGDLLGGIKDYIKGTPAAPTVPGAGAATAATTAAKAIPTAAPTGALGGVTAPPGGEGFVGFIKSLGQGLASLAPIAVPMLIGAGAIAGVIAIVGAGVAAAIAVIGLSLPVFGRGLKDIAEIDGMNLAKVAFGITALGGAMVVFTAGSIVGGLGSIAARLTNFFSGGGPIAMIKESVTALSPVLPQLTTLGPALNNYANGIMAFGKAVSTVDIAKAEQLKKIMAGPSIAESITAAGSKMIQAATNIALGTGGSETKKAEEEKAKTAAKGPSTEEKTYSELQTLNTNMRELLRHIKDTAENTKKTHEATKNLNGNMFAA
jgi:hypothetical protein